ncbi:hypothetical protein KDL44_10255 [bacterium]|nr:hypothetical protein [bacterium]
MGLKRGLAALSADRRLRFWLVLHALQGASALLLMLHAWMGLEAQGTVEPAMHLPRLAVIVIAALISALYWTGVSKALRQRVEVLETTVRSLLREGGLVQRILDNRVTPPGAGLWQDQGQDTEQLIRWIGVQKLDQKLLDELPDSSCSYGCGWLPLLAVFLLALGPIERVPAIKSWMQYLAPLMFGVIWALPPRDRHMLPWIFRYMLPDEISRRLAE